MKKTQKFSIRKHKFGAASVLLGIMVFIGIGQHHEAEAAEDVKKQSAVGNISEDNSEIDEDTTEQANVEQEQNQDLKLQEENQQSQSEDQTEVNAVSAQPVKAEAQEQVPSNTTVKASETKSVETGEGEPATQNQTAPQSLTAPTTPKSAETQTSTSPQVRATTYNNPQQGQDVTNKVKVTKSSIEVPNNNENSINPHNAERAKLNYEWEFEQGIKKNDYFDFTISNNVNTNGINIRKKVPDIKNGSLVMATGQVLENGGIRYTFTDYVDDKINVKANLSLNLFIDPMVVKEEGKQTITSKIGDQTVTKDVNIKYLKGVNHHGIEVNGSIESLDKEKGTFTHVAYINPNGRSIGTASVYGRITEGQKANAGMPKVEIYEYVGQGNLPSSVIIEKDKTDLYKNVTDSLKQNLTINNENYQLNFESLNKKYVIVYEGYYKNDTDKFNFQTQMSGYPSIFNNYYYGNATWNNGIKFYDNNANGAGVNAPIVESNLFQFEKLTAAEGAKGFNDGTVEVEDTNPLEWEEISTPEGMHGENSADTLIEDSNPIEISESTHENSEHHSDVVEFEEETNPGGSESQHESNIVEYDEDTAKGIVIGTVTDHTTVEDTKEYTTENNLVELEDTLNPNVSGQAEGPIEEITENDDYNEMSGLGLEGGDSGYTETEEIDENHFIDTNSQLGTENGTNSDDQTFEEDTKEDKPVYQIGSNQETVEDTTLPNEGGINSSNQTFEEDTDEDKPVYQIGSSQEIVEDTTLPNESGMNSDNQTFEEDTEEDKDVIQQGGDSPVDITEDTQPQISGQHQGEQTFEEDTLTPDQPQPPVDREFTPQDNVPSMPPTDEEISPKDPEMLTPPVNEETQPNQPESPTPQEDKEINPNQPHPSSPPMENITANDSKTPVVPKDSETVPSVSKQTTMTSGQAKKTNQSEAMVQTENQKSQINQAEDAKENQHSTTDEKALPITGQGKANQTPIVLGTMIGVFGLLLLRRRKSNHHTK
ncbi:YSIRK-type signal peptide-containing protein [Staphylococcus schleiferi subsp. coagulans]|uniref:fibrinogen-binding adhesin SdrG C-terminal domain-containing protein n=1 Tax=Staphylococcus coagulans TaxID=74706 RepID=UPI0015FE12E7|nr:YSIRK-type signal peptide-containing protein [Staphylococcus coagulans]MBA8767936.1 YSIRK-type signal peptide-containing protein [Staphylococcus coagulans]